MLAGEDSHARPRLRKGERQERILLELKLRPHVGISELAERFKVSTETVRRDFETLSGEGLISRAHGGASARPHQHYPGFDERNRDRIEERERIGRRAAALVLDGDTLMIDAGSTTLQMARFLAFRGTACTVITNSLHIAMTLAQGEAAEVILCPGDVLGSETAVVGPDAIEYLSRFTVGKCFFGASSIATGGVSETVRGFAAIKRAMLRQSRAAHLLADGSKFGRSGLAEVSALGDISSVITDRAPATEIQDALEAAGVELIVAD